MNIRGEDSLVSLVDIFGGDDLDLGTNFVLGTEIKHFLSLADAADHRSGKGTTTRNQRKGVDWQRLGRSADVDQRPIQGQQLQEGADVDTRADGVDDQVEGSGKGFERFGIFRRVVVIGAQLQTVFLLLSERDRTVTSAPMAWAIFTAMWPRPPSPMTATFLPGPAFQWFSGE